MDYETLKRLDHAYLWHPFTQMQEWMVDEPCIIREGDGHYLIDVDGRKYLDGVSSLWCNLYGHRKREIDDAIKAQLDQIAHSTFLGLSHVPGIRLAQKLIEIAPKGLQRVFYSDNGATAVEVALKMAVQYWQLKGEIERAQIASLAESYHGDTVGSMSMGYSETFHRFHKSLLFPVVRLTPPHVFRYHKRLSEQDALNAAVREAEEKLTQSKDSLAALIMEPLMQGAAGMWSQPVEYVKAIDDICRGNGILVIFDEVATGFGRTGKMFACEHSGVTPDILCLAKGITGGYLPLAATLTTEEIFSAFLGEYKDSKTFFHGHTYTGNPLGCAAALANLDLFERDRILEKMQPRISHLKQRLYEDFLQLPHVSDVRQWGFMVGIELVEDKARRTTYAPERRIGHKVILEARKNGVMIRPLGDVVILMPPLSITDDELAVLLDVTLDSIRVVTEGRGVCHSEERSDEESSPGRDSSPAAQNDNEPRRAMTNQYYVYIMTNKSRTLYTGVTNDLERRVHEHKQKLVPGFTSKYNITKLVYFEMTEDVMAALAREKQIKGWLRRKKITLIESVNPKWADLSAEFV